MTPSGDSQVQPAALEDEIDKIESLIAGANRLVAEKKPVDLALLEDRVEALCAAITQAPVEVGKPLAPRLQDMLGMLNALEGALIETFGATQRMAETDARLQATKSYGEHTDKSDKNT